MTFLMLSGQIFRVEQNLNWSIWPGMWEISFLALHWWVNPSRVGLMHPRPAQSEATADPRALWVGLAWLPQPTLGWSQNLQRDSCETLSRAGLSPSCIKKHMQFTEKTWAVLSALLALHMEKLFKRQIIWGTSLAQCWQSVLPKSQEKEWVKPLIQICPKAGFGSWNPKTRASVNLLLQLGPTSGGHEDHSIKTGWSEVQDFPVWKKLPACYRCSPVGLCEQPWFSQSLHICTSTGVLVLLRRWIFEVSLSWF